MGEIKVSVVIAVYNAGTYLCEAMDSLINQTLKDIEIICVDDGSIDDSYEILQRYEQQDERVKVLRHMEKTAGAGAARNLGMHYAKGEYISVLDADDFFELDMLAKAYEKVHEAQADVVIFNGYMYDHKAKSDGYVNFILRTDYLPDKEIFTPAENAEHLFQMTLGAAWNLMLSRNFIQVNKLEFQSIHHADDLVFVYLAFACARKIAILNERLIHYRRNNESSQSATRNKWPESAYLAPYLLKQKLIEKDLYERYRLSFVQRALDYAVFYLDGISDVENFHKLFYGLQNEYLEKLGAFEIEDKQFENEQWVKRRDLLKNSTSEEYLLKLRYDEFHSTAIQKISHYSTFKELIPINSKMVLYGAGDVGTSVFCNLMLDKGRTVCAWVDKNFKKLGYPVLNPEVLRNMDFEYILIAIKDEGIYHNVKCYLLEMNILESQICWIPQA